MASRTLLLVCLLSLLVFPQALALQVTPNSPCSSACIDKEGIDLSDPNSSTTKPGDVVCKDREYGSPAGQKWQKCMSCLQNSTFSQGSESDQQWFLYNQRYSVNSCVFNHFNQSGISVGVCATSRACGAIEQALKYDGLVAGAGAEYGYCEADGGAMTNSLFSQCLSCVKTGGETIFLANAIVALEAGCLQKPAKGAILGLSGSVFSKTVIAIVDPTTINQPAQNGSSGPPTAVIAGAAVGVVVILLIVAAIAFICIRKRRNRAARSTPVLGSNNGIFSNHRPTSSLSFRCQAHLDPLSPRYQPNEPSIAEAAWDTEQQRPGITSTRRTSTNPWGPDSVRGAADNVSIATSQKSGAFTGTVAPVYLNPLTTSLPQQPPAAYQSPSSGIRKSPKTPNSGFENSPSSATHLLPPSSHIPYVPQQYGIAMPLTGTEQANGHYTTGAAAANPASPVSNKRLQDIWADAMAVNASPVSTKAHNDIWSDALANQRPNRNAGAGGLYRAATNNSTSTKQSAGEPVSAASLLRNDSRWAEALAAQQAAAYNPGASKKAQDVYGPGVYRPGQETAPPKSPNEAAWRKKARESSSNSPVETKHVQVAFPPPPPRR